MGRTYKDIPDTRKTHGNQNPNFGDIVYHVRDFNRIHDDFPIQIYICDKYIRCTAIKTGFEFFKYYVDNLKGFLESLIILKLSALNVEYSDIGKHRLMEHKAKRRQPYKFEKLWIQARNANS